MQLEQKTFIERTLAAQTAEQQLSDLDFQDWSSSGFTTRLYCHYGKVFVVWRQFFDVPGVVDGLEIRGVTCDTREGFGVMFRNGQGQTQWISHTPKRLFDLPIFAHVPYMSELTFMPRSTEHPGFVLRFPVVFKTAHNPSQPLREGATYLSQLGEFRNTFPQYKDLKL